MFVLCGLYCFAYVLPKRLHGATTGSLRAPLGSPRPPTVRRLVPPGPDQHDDVQRGLAELTERVDAMESQLESKMDNMQILLQQLVDKVGK